MFTKTKIILALLIIAAAASAVLYYYFFLRPFKTLATLSYDARIAAQLLSDPQTIVFTKEGDVMLSNLKGEELLLITGENDFSRKMANFRISHSRNYITWQSSAGIAGLNVLSRQVFLIYSGEPRQSFDSSPVDDKILYITKDQLVEVDLTNERKVSVLSSLPQIDNPDMKFNHTGYSPDGQSAYIRSIFSGNPQGKKEAVVNLQSGKINFLPEEFTEPIGLSPLWLADSAHLMALRFNGIEILDLASGKVSTIIQSKNEKGLVGAIGPYAVDPSGQLLSFIVAKDKIAGTEATFTNHQLIFGNLDGTNQKTIISSSDERLGENTNRLISDVGWLDNDRIWFTLSWGYASKDLYTISKDGTNLQRLYENLDKYSQPSVSMDLYEIII